MYKTLVICLLLCGVAYAGDTDSDLKTTLCERYLNSKNVDLNKALKCIEDVASSATPKIDLGPFLSCFKGGDDELIKAAHTFCSTPGFEDPFSPTEIPCITQNGEPLLGPVLGNPGLIGKALNCLNPSS